MPRKAVIPFKAGNISVRTIEDLKKALKTQPIAVLQAAKDGRLQRFLKGFGIHYESLFEEYSYPQEIVKALANLLGIHIDIDSLTNQEDETLISSEEDLEKAVSDRVNRIRLGKGTFVLKELVLNYPVSIEGLGRNDTLLKVTTLVIQNPKVSLKDITVEADHLILEKAILNAENVSLYSNSHEFNFASGFVKLQKDSYIQLGKLKQYVITESGLTLTKDLLNKYIEKCKKITFKNASYICVKDDLFFEDVDIRFINCNLYFKPNTGLVLKNGTFIAENSTFETLSEKESWKNITIGGKIKGYIKSCTFKDGKGRKAEEINQLLGLGLGWWVDVTYGGGLFVYSTEGNFLISDSSFKDCKADFGGGVLAWDSTTIENCTFDNCSASKSGGGVYAYSSTVENCTFDNCQAKYGGGVLASEKTKIENCSFENCFSSNGGGICAYKKTTIVNSFFNHCVAFSKGGGVYIEGENSNVTIENCLFENCLTKETGGAIYCENSSNTLIGNSFKNCKPNNCGGECSC